LINKRYAYLAAKTFNYPVISGVPSINQFKFFYFSLSQKNISNKIEFGVIA